MQRAGSMLLFTFAREAVLGEQQLQPRIERRDLIRLAADFEHDMRQSRRHERSSRRKHASPATSAHTPIAAKAMA